MSIAHPNPLSEGGVIESCWFDTSWNRQEDLSPCLKTLTTYSIVKALYFCLNPANKQAAGYVEGASLFWSRDLEATVPCNHQT